MNQIGTITRRVNSQEVEVVDDFNRAIVISADSLYNPGDRVLMTSGVIVRKVGAEKIYTVEV